MSTYVTVTLLFLFTIPVVGDGQSVELLQKLYPDKLAVFSNINRTVEIGFQKGVPYAQAFEVSEMVILNDRANGIYNKEKVYHSTFNELKKLEAYTLLPEGNNTRKIKVTDYKVQSSPGQNVFYDDMKETSFDYPHMMKGSISHVETEYYNKDIRFLSTFYFSNYLPTHNASYSITFPEDVDVRYIIRNDENKIVQVKESSRGKKKKLEFTAKEIKNYERYANGTAIPYYALHVIVYVANYQNQGAKVPVFSSVDELYQWSSGFIKNINTVPDGNLNRLADSICKNKTTDRQKAQAIFQWVQEHIKYVAFEAGLEGFIPRQASEVYLKRYGDCKDMASILIALLKRSGLQAHFTWIGTRDIPYSYKEVPLPMTDNHMIIAVKIENEWIFLDATDPNCIFGLPTSGIQGKEALISINQDEYQIVKVPVIPAAVSHVTDSTFLTIHNNELLGRCVVTYTGYMGSEMYNQLQYNKGEDERIYIKGRMTKGNNKFIMNDYTIHLEDRMHRKAKVVSNFRISDYVKSIDDEIYINLNLEKLVERTPIDTGNRKIAIAYDYLYSVDQIHALTIPDGYQTEYIPANFSVTNDLIAFSITYLKKGKEIIATQHFELKKLYVQVSDFAEWNKTISAISNAYKEQVVLKKK